MYHSFMKKELSASPFEMQMLKARENFSIVRRAFPCSASTYEILQEQTGKTLLNCQKTPYPKLKSKESFLMNSPDGSGTRIRIQDIVDFQEFASDGLMQRKCCDFLILPDHLQNKNLDLLTHRVLHTENGAFPVQPLHAVNQCPPLPVRFDGNDCHQAIHGYDAVMMSTIFSCKIPVTYVV